MKYRKIFALLLAAATLFSLAACGETAAGPEATPAGFKPFLGARPGVNLLA